LLLKVEAARSSEILHGVTMQKTSIESLITMKTSKVAVRPGIKLCCYIFIR
jgi:hypothetical protein